MRFRILSTYVAPSVVTTAVGCCRQDAENEFALTPPRLCIDRSEASRCPSGDQCNTADTAGSIASARPADTGLASALPPCA